MIVSYIELSVTYLSPSSSSSSSSTSRTTSSISTTAVSVSGGGTNVNDILTAIGNGSLKRRDLNRLKRKIDTILGTP